MNEGKFGNDLVGSELMKSDEARREEKVSELYSAAVDLITSHKKQFDERILSLRAIEKGQCGFIRVLNIYRFRNHRHLKLVLEGSPPASGSRGNIYYRIDYVRAGIEFSAYFVSFKYPALEQREIATLSKALRGASVEEIEGAIARLPVVAFTDEYASELISADAPAGTGTELESSPAPEGNGLELISSDKKDSQQ